MAKSKKTRAEQIAYLTETADKLKGLINDYLTAGESDFYKIQSKLNILLEGAIREETRYFVPYELMPELYEDVAEAFDFTVSVENNITTIYFPFLLPSRKSVHYEYWRNLLTPCFMANKDKFIRYMGRTHIILTSIYEPEMNMIDYDNLVIKSILDQIRDHCLVGDNPECIKLTMDAEIGECMGTRIEIRETEPLKKVS